MNIQIYHKSKNELIEITEALVQSPQLIDDPSEIDDIRNNLMAGRFRLVVLGQFKRGKSTFINALLGEKVLPTDVIPLTAVITEVQYGKEEKAVVFFNEGKEKEISYQEVSEYVAEGNNPENIKGVDKVILYHTAEILKDGLLMVDTPGVGSIHEHNTRLTREYIPQVDAAVFLFSTDPPLTELEQEFLKILTPFVPHFFFILNKKDYLDDDEIEKVKRFNEKILSAINNHKPEVFPISSKQALQARLENNHNLLEVSGIIEFQNTLNNFLMEQKGKFLIVSNSDRLIRHLNRKRNLLYMERKARNLSVESLETNLKKFKEYMQSIEHQDQRIQSLLTGLKDRLIELYDTNGKEFIIEHSGSIKQAFHDNISSNYHLNKRKIFSVSEKLVNDSIIDHFEPFRLSMEKLIRENYEREIEHLNNEANNIIDEIYKYSADLFNLDDLAKLPRNVWCFESQFYYKTWETISTLDLIEKDIMFLLPKKIFLYFHKRKLNQLIYTKLERQYGRLRSDLLYRIQDVNRNFVFEFKKALKNIKEEISSLIKNNLKLKQAGEKEMEEINAQQDKLLKTIDDFIARIEKVKNAVSDDTKQETI